MQRMMNLVQPIFVKREIYRLQSELRENHVVQQRAGHECALDHAAKSTDACLFRGNLGVFVKEVIAKHSEGPGAIEYPADMWPVADTDLVKATQWPVPERLRRVLGEIAGPRPAQALVHMRCKYPTRTDMELVEIVCRRVSDQLSLERQERILSSAMHGLTPASCTFRK